MTDSELVARILAGDRDAFRALVERYQDAVFAVAASKMGGRADAEDVAQDTFVAAFESLARLKDPAKFGSWLYGIARNKVRMHLRATKLRQPPSEALSARSQLAPDETLARKELRETVSEALRRLKDAQRETAMLFYINGYSQADIAQFTALPLGTVKRRLHDARKQLKKELIGMVKDELAESRPDAAFAKRVVSRINNVRAYVLRKRGRVMVTDAKGRSIYLSASSPGIRDLKPWLAKTPPRKDPDIYAALAQCLAEFGWRLHEVVIETDMNGVHRSSLRIQGNSGAIEVPAETIDALLLAVHADAPIYVAEALAATHVFKDEAGNFFPPNQAWRHLAKTVRESENEIERPPFNTVADVIRALKKKRDDYHTRRAFTEAIEGPFHWTPPRIKDKRNGWATFKRWVERAKGTRWEGLAAGLMGAVHLWPKGDARGALPYYERAHRALPDDDAVTFEFATACVFAGRKGQAMKLLRRNKDKPGADSPTRCGNFCSLWGDARFVKLFGDPDPRFARVFAIPQLELIGVIGDNVEHFTKKIVPLRLRATLKEAQKRRVEEWARTGVLLPVTNVSLIVPPELAASLTVVAADHNLTGLRLTQYEKPIFERAYSHYRERDPHTAETVIAVLEAIGVKLEAGVLTHTVRGILHGLLLVKNQEHQAVIPILGASGIALALMAERPVLIAEKVAMKWARTHRETPQFSPN